MLPLWRTSGRHFWYSPPLSIIIEILVLKEYAKESVWTNSEKSPLGREMAELESTVKWVGPHQGHATWNFLFPREFLAKALVYSPYKTAHSHLMISYICSFSHPALCTLKPWKKQMLLPYCYTLYPPGRWEPDPPASDFWLFKLF